MYDFAEPAPSCWRDMPSAEPAVGGTLHGGCEVDIAILGGGFTGLSAALHLARDHAARCCVLEAGEIGWGASGRNGGFCCLYPSRLSLQELTRRFGECDTKAFLNAQLEAIDLVDQLAESEGIDLCRQGNGTYEVAHAPARTGELADYADALRSRFGIPARYLDREAFAETVHDATEQFGGVHVQAGFGLNPLGFVRGLARAAARHGAGIYTGSRVLDLTRERGGYRLETAQGSVRAKRLIIAANGYLPESLVPQLKGRSVPVISNILSTRVLQAAELAAQRWHTQSPCSNTRRLLFYYRLLRDGRFLFGARGDTRGSPAAAARMRRWMSRRFREVFPAWRDVEITHYWRGLVCMSASGLPAIGALDEANTAFYGMAFHGNGVAAAPWTGRLLAALSAGVARLDSIPRLMRGPSPRVPVPALRRWYLRTALAWYRLRDRR